MVSRAAEAVEAAGAEAEAAAEAVAEGVVGASKAVCILSQSLHLGTVSIFQCASRHPPLVASAPAFGSFSGTCVDRKRKRSDSHLARPPPSAPMAGRGPSPQPAGDAPHTDGAPGPTSPRMLNLLPLATNAFTASLDTLFNLYGLPCLALEVLSRLLTVRAARSNVPLDSNFNKHLCPLWRRMPSSPRWRTARRRLP